MPNTLHQIFSLDENSLTEFSPVPLFPLGAICEIADSTDSLFNQKFIYAKLDTTFSAFQPLIMRGKGQEGQAALANVPYAVTGNPPLLFTGVSQLDPAAQGFVAPSQDDYMFFLIEGKGKVRSKVTAANLYLRLIATEDAFTPDGTVFSNETRAVSLSENISGGIAVIDAFIFQKAAEIN